jgi:hypothetical protein
VTYDQARSRASPLRTNGANPMERPTWWEWELELTPHLQKRMEDRDFTEVDLRVMLGGASAMGPTSCPVGSPSPRVPAAVVGK